MKQKAQITFEEQETLIARQSDNCLMGFCPRCAARVQLITPEILALLTGGTEREIFRLLEAGKIYFFEARRLYACPGCYEKSQEDTAFPGK